MRGTHQLQVRLDDLGALRGAKVGQAVPHVGGDAPVRKQGGLLGDESGSTSARRKPDLSGGVGEDAVVVNDAHGCHVATVEARKEAKQSALSGAGVTVEDGPGRAKAS